MTNQPQGLDLTDVKARFLEAEERLREVATEAASMATSATQLADTSLAVREASGRLGELATEVSSVSASLNEATAALIAVDPKAVLESIHTSDANHVAAHDGILERLAADNRRLRLLVTAAVILSLVAAAASVIALLA